jgi:hypothetical protein
VAFAAAGMVVSVGLWVLFGRWFGDTMQSAVGAMLLGSLFSAFLDLRYRWLGELNPEPPPADAKPPEPKPEESIAGQLTTSSLSFAQRCGNLIWPFAGGHILWLPLWTPAAFLFAAYFMGYLDWLFPRGS